MSRVTTTQVCDLASLKLREGAAQQSPIQNTKAGYTKICF